MIFPQKYIVLSVVAVALLGIGLVGYDAWKEHKANVATQQAQQHHEAGIASASQGQVAATEGDLAIHRAQQLQGKLAVANAEVERLKTLLKAKDQSPHVAGPGPLPPLPDSPNTEGGVKDGLIAAQDKEIGLLKMQNEEYRSAAESYKASSGFYQKAYEEECRSHNLDNLAHQAKLAAQKSETIKIGILSFGGGAAIGYLSHR